MRWYSQIGMRLKAEAPASKTLMVTLANGSAGSGYIYSDEAYSHLTFQVIGSRLKPGCAEGEHRVHRRGPPAALLKRETARP